jgi:hypothetical protein
MKAYKFFGVALIVCAVLSRHPFYPIEARVEDMVRMFVLIGLGFYSTVRGLVGVPGERLFAVALADRVSLLSPPRESSAPDTARPHAAGQHQ